MDPLTFLSRDLSVTYDFDLTLNLYLKCSEFITKH